MRRLHRLLFFAVLLSFSCSSQEGPDAANNAQDTTGGKGDDTGQLVGVVHNETLREVDFSLLNDPIARHVLRSGDDLPTTFTETVEKLDEFDTEGCDGGAATAHRTFLVSETAQVLGEPSVFRSFTQRQCGSRDSFSLIFSVFGVSPAFDIPDSAEVMAFDETAGVFNYYEVSEGEWSYFGDSIDLLEERGGRCQNCHTGGGLVMKELDTPWLHWEGHEPHPGAADLIAANSAVLGRHGTSAATTERIVKDGNRKWNETRLTTLVAEQDVRKVLEPLFCTVEVNLDNSADFKQTTISRFPTDAFLDPQLKLFGGDVQMTEELYQAALTEANQRVEDEGGNVLATDTVFRMVFPERSFIDNDFIKQAQRAGVLDIELIKDVLMVDFTRPIFSDDRCALLSFAPTADQLGDCCKTCSDGAACGDTCIAAGSSCSAAEGCACGVNGPLTAERIRAGLIANLEAASPAEGTPAAALLTNLSTRDDVAAHDQRVNDYVAACRARDQGAFMTDAMLMLSAARTAASRLSVFEFAATMPVDDLQPPPGIRFDPGTCELANN